MRKFMVLLAAVLMSMVFPPTGRSVAVPPVESGGEGAVFRIDLANNGASGGGTWSGTVTVSAYADATFTEPFVARGEAIVSNGNWSMQFPFPTDLQPGQAFVATDGTRTKLLTDTDLRITGFDYANDVITGSGAIGNGVVQVCTGGEWTNLPTGCTFTAQADQNGNWSWDLIAVDNQHPSVPPWQIDLVPGVMQTQASQSDSNGDTVSTDALMPPWPHIAVQYPYAVNAMGFDAGAAVHLQVVWPDAQTTEHDAVAVVGNNGMVQAQFDLGGRNLEPGTQLTLTGPVPAFMIAEEPIERMLTVTPPEITDINLQTQLVSGSAAPNTNVVLYPYEPNPSGGWVRRHTITNDVGVFPPQTFVTPGDEPSSEQDTITMTAAGAVGLEAYDDDFDTQMVRQDNSVVGPTLNVMPSTGLSDGQPVEVSGSGFPGGVNLIMCPAVGSNCDMSTMQSGIPVDPSGNFATGFTVRRFLQSGVDCGATPGACAVVAFDPGNPFGRNARVTVSFLPPLGPIVVRVAATGSVSSVSGWATVSGTVRCSDNVPVSITGSLWQRIDKRTVAQGTFATSTTCQAGRTVTWVAIVVPSGPPIVPFGAGNAQVVAVASAQRFGETVSGNVTAIQKLVKVKPTKK